MARARLFSGRSTGEYYCRTGDDWCRTEKALLGNECVIECGASAIGDHPTIRQRPEQLLAVISSRFSASSLTWTHIRIQPNFDNSLQVLYSPQESSRQSSLPWTTPAPIQSPYWMVDARAHSPCLLVPLPAQLATNPAVNSLRGISAYHQPYPRATFHAHHGAIPLTQTRRWATNTSSSPSSNARPQPFIEKLYSLLGQPASFAGCLM